jgi:ferrous iron transport protein A
MAEGFAGIPAAELTMSKNTVWSLGDLPEGARATVLRLQGGRGFLGRMTALGFTEGAQVVLLRNSGRGPVIVLIRDTRVALGRGEALKVLVSLEEGGSGNSQH